jgi:MFS family permease
VLFTAASLACGFADNIALLVGLRAIQSVGGGAFMPSATGIVADNFGRGRDRALGMFTSIPPIGIVLIMLAAVFLPAGAPRSAERIDVRGVALLGAMVLSGMFAIAYLGSGEVPVYCPVFLLGAAIAVVAGVAFVRHAKHGDNPFIPIELLRGRGFGVMNLINLCFGAAAIGFGAQVPLYAEQRFGILSLHAGSLLTARAVGSIGVAALAVLALRRTGHRLPMAVGFTVTAVGLAAMYATPGGVFPMSGCRSLLASPVSAWA